MKIGMLTFWWSEDNYGQLLQCYALQKYLRDAGHDAYLIRYRYEVDGKYTDILSTPLFIRLLKACNPIRLYTHLKYLYKKKQKENLIGIEQNVYPRKFSNFRSKYINQSEKIYTSWLQLKENPPQADMYIVGSDQVWNFLNMKVYQCRNIIHTYFLDFGSEKTKRVSYAASWGVTSIPQSYITEIKPLLSRFKNVSVREKDGVKLCEMCGFTKAEWAPDPTLLLSPSIYRELYKENKIRYPKKKYFLLYMVGNMCEFDINVAYEWANKRELDVIYVTGNSVIDKRQKYFATIPEWLYLIDNAEYVVTNSFHGSVFSILFEKQFAVVPLVKEHAGMNSRLESLFEQFGMKDRFIVNDNLDILNLRYQVTCYPQPPQFLKGIKEIIAGENMPEREVYNYA